MDSQAYFSAWLGIFLKYFTRKCFENLWYKNVMEKSSHYGFTEFNGIDFTIIHGFTRYFP